MLKKLNFPKLRQTYTYDCGASALQAVLVYYGIEEREETVMKAVKTTPEGTFIPNIIKAAQKYGLEIDSRTMTTGDLKNYIDKKIPVIIDLQAWPDNKKTDWKNNWEDGHYVVAIGYSSHKIYFSDPSSFYLTYLTFQELEERWHDVDEDGKKYSHHGIAVFGKEPKYDNLKKIHLG